MDVHTVNPISPGDIIKVPAPLLSEKDVAAMERIAALESELKLLKKDLEPKIERFVKERGEGMKTIAGRYIEFKKTVKSSTEWQKVALSLGVPQEQVLAVAETFRKTNENYSYKLKGKEEDVSRPTTAPVGAA